MKPVTYKSSDGLEIPAYLTLPKGVPANNLPTLVLPHGGPWGRDAWGYNSLAQFFANRGYAVLMPNFRGSTGYGRKFLDAGNLEWGRKMQDDVTWGVKYLVAQGIADPKRVGIIGGSYGGYATSTALFREVVLVEEKMGVRNWQFSTEEQTILNASLWPVHHTTKNGERRCRRSLMLRKSTRRKRTLRKLPGIDSFCL